MAIDFDRVPRSDGNFAWPGDARLAVVLTSEYEPVYETKPLAGGTPNYRDEAERRYEATRGLWRVLDILDRHGAKATFCVSGASAERYPESAREIALRGHEVAAHSWNGADHVGLTRDKEDAVIGRSVAALTDAVGERPVGWLTPRAQISGHTIELLAKHGFTWHSDCFDDDLPYLIEVGGRPLVEVPRSALTDDTALIGNLTRRPLGSSRALLSAWIDEFDVLYAESRTAARLFSVNWHHCIVGLPGASKVLDDLLTHVRRHDGLWFATGRDVAEFWLRHRSAT
jgi:peptidoglycan/xylan/chitin deacetylase (PgdA/CDA1 family)